MEGYLSTVMGGGVGAAGMPQILHFNIHHANIIKVLTLTPWPMMTTRDLRTQHLPKALLGITPEDPRNQASGYPVCYKLFSLTLYHANFVKILMRLSLPIMASRAICHLGWRTITRGRRLILSKAWSSEKMVCYTLFSLTWCHANFVKIPMVLLLVHLPLLPSLPPSPTRQSLLKLVLEFQPHQLHPRRMIGLQPLSTKKGSYPIGKKPLIQFWT